MLSPEEVLTEHPFFTGISDDHLEFLVSVARPLHIESNRFLFRQGSTADCFLVLHNGDMALELHVGARGARIIQTISPGEVVGWSWLFPPYRWMFDGRALNTVDCLCLDGEAVRTRMETDHEFGYEVFRRFGEVIVEALNRTRLQLLDLYGTGD
ncbi:MAG: Crp/Fnr family transcriptional regulator [Acidimicrobiia bacterium]